MDLKAVIASLVLFVVTSLPASSQERSGWDRMTAQTDYLFLCSGCHGRTGTGDGVVSDKLKVPPADLTILATRNNGIFPYYEVIKVIDGRQMIESHGVREMPVWGWHFRELARGSEILLPLERQVKNRVEDLARYISTLQAN